MRYRRRRSGPAVSVPFLLAMFGVGITLVGLLGLSTAIYLTGTVAQADDVGVTLTLLVEPMELLYDNGILTLFAGGTVFLSGTIMLIR